MLDTRTRNTIADFFNADPSWVQPERIAAFKWQTLRRIPGIGLKSMHAIKAWMGDAGYRYSPTRGWKRDAIDVSPASERLCAVDSPLICVLDVGHEGPHEFR